jgi:hypothetical protein
MLRLLPTPPEPVRDAPGRAELGSIGDALDQEGRRLLRKRGVAAFLDRRA